jgi:transposase
MLKSTKIQGVQAVGVDVCKERLDADAGPGHRFSLPNDAAGIRALLDQLPPGAHLFCESTGGWEAPLRRAALQARIPISTVNPWRVRRFAEAQGCLAKTDALDARTLREFGERMRVRRDEPQPAALQELHPLLTLREELVKVQTQLANSLVHQPSVFAQRLLQKLQKSLAQEIERLEKKMHTILRQDPVLAPRYAWLLSQYGIGETIATTLLCLLPELGTLNRAQAAALAGIAPYADDSGPRRGTRHIRGGRPRVRRALYLATVTAIRQNGSPLRAFYTRLKAAGKASKVALIATARKFLTYLNSQLHQLSLLPPSTTQVAAT